MERLAPSVHFQTLQYLCKAIKKYFFSDIRTAVYLWVGSPCCQGVQIPHITSSRNDISDCGILGLNLSDCITTRNDTIKRRRSQSSWLFQKNSKWQLHYIYSSAAIFITKGKICLRHTMDSTTNLSTFQMHTSTLNKRVLKLNLVPQQSWPLGSGLFSF